MTDTPDPKAPVTGAEVLAAGLASRDEHGVGLLGGGDVVGQREGDRPVAAADRPDLGLEPGLGPQGEHHPVGHLDHHHLAGHVEGGLPAEAVEVEPPRRLEVGHGQGDEAESLVHPPTVSDGTDRLQGRDAVVTAGPPHASAAAVRALRLLRCRPSASKFATSNQPSYAGARRRHSASVIDHQAVSLLRPLVTMACRKIPSKV